MPKIICRFNVSEKLLFLTFDDGPNPNSTPLILKCLQKYNIKATFFCLGYKVKQHPSLLEDIKASGHCVGNHGYMHLNGWKVKTVEYIENLKKSDFSYDLKLFRPPYGKLSLSQYNKLKDDYNIMLWLAQSYDYNLQIPNIKSFESLKNNTHNGNIVLFHDKDECIKKTLPLLEKYIEYVNIMNYSFAIPNKILVSS